MTNAISKFKFKDLCLLSIFRLSTDDKALILIKVGKTSAVEFTPSGEHGTDTLPYVYSLDEKKVRLAKGTHVYPMSKRLLLSLDFHTEDELIDEAKTSVNEAVDCKHPNLGAVSVNNPVFHPHPQLGTQDAGMKTSPPSKAKPPKKNRTVKKATKGKK